MRTSRPTLRTVQTITSSVLASNGILTVRRYEIPQYPQVQSLTVPDKIHGFYVKNTGANLVRFNFNTDAQSDYIEIMAEEFYPFVIPINSACTINATAMSGLSAVEVLFYG